jgi:hypothetical protein
MKKLLRASKRHFLRKSILISGVFLITVCALLAFSKGHKIIEKLSLVIDNIPPTVAMTQRAIKFGLEPTINVNNSDNLVTHPIKQIRSAIANGPLRVNLVNPRYFTDGSGKAIFLTGSHTWDNRQDMGTNIFDYDRYLSLLNQYNHNFVRLWIWEQPKGITTTPDPAKPMDILTPEIFARVGPGAAADGGLKFDVTQYNQKHLDRLRQRIIEAGNRGIYVSVMLFDGWSIEKKAGGANPWIYHPFNRNNNVNGINGDFNNDQSGTEIHTLQIPAITQIQENYVQKVIDTVNDLDNVLYEISNESQGNSQDWQYHMINYIKAYEATKPKQHPVGMTFNYPHGSNGSLFNSPADWIAPNEDGGYKDDPPAATGKKVIFSDTDHLWGIGGDRVWAWKSFTRGLNPLYMDPWDSEFIPVKPNMDLRINLGYILSFANRMNLAAMSPQDNLSSTGYCLANSANNAEYLIYSSTGDKITVDLSVAKGDLAVEWFNPSNGLVMSGTRTTGGGNRTFISPFAGDAVLYIRSSSS